MSLIKLLIHDDCHQNIDFFYEAKEKLTENYQEELDWWKISLIFILNDVFNRNQSRKKNYFVTCTRCFCTKRTMKVTADELCLTLTQGGFELCDLSWKAVLDYEDYKIKVYFALWVWILILVEASWGKKKFLKCAVYIVMHIARAIVFLLMISLVNESINFSFPIYIPIDI